MKKSLHNGWAQRRENQRWQEGFARSWGHKDHASMTRDSNIQRLKAALENAGGDSGELFRAAVVSAALEVPVKRLRLLVRVGLLRSRTKGCLSFRAADLRRSEVAIKIRNSALLRQQNYSLADLVTRQQAGVLLAAAGPSLADYYPEYYPRRLKKIRIGSRVFFLRRQVEALQRRIIS